ncbi:MAG: ABC transporter permease [Planctomycetota bacterium]
MLKFLEMVRLGLRNLRGYPLRTFLTTLGVVFGVGSVIAMLSLGAGAEHELLEEIGRLGIQNIIVNSVKPPEASKGADQGNFVSRHGLTFKDYRRIRETVTGVKEILPVHYSRKTVWWGSRRVEATVFAIQPRQMDLLELAAARGRGITAVDADDLARVCVIRAGLLQSLGIYEDPVGILLQVDDEAYRVVGVLEDVEFLGYARKALSIDAKATEIYVPYDTVLKRQGTLTVRRGTGFREITDVELSQLIVSVEELDDVLVTARMLDAVLQKDRKEKDYEVVVPLEVLAQRRKTQQVFNIALVAIASISLLVGGIGIANIMLATVTERTQEIGVRRALGAKKRHVMAQFLTETTTIASLGGILGVAMGLGLVYALTSFTGWKAIVTPSSVVLSLSISMAVGILSGIFPARRAANLDPIAALRRE